MIILTCAPAAKQIAANELCLIDPTAKFIERISQGVCIFETDNNFFTNSQKHFPVFFRHVMPVDLYFKANTEIDIVNFLNPLFKRMDKNKLFSVQTRNFSKDINLSPFSVNSAISEYQTQNGFTLNIKNPAQILSIVIASDKIYAGLSTPLMNMSKWCGGAPVYSKDNAFISRAEFKLLEAMEIFNISFVPGQNALDLGAAPGGWSKVLINHGLNVTAVDPANLSDTLKGKVTHIKSTAQQYFRQEPVERFDIITNDMKIDVNEAMDILFIAKKYLTTNGIIITTLKLPEKNQQKTSSRAIKILSTEFNVYARQLFHNRSEICAVCRIK